MLWKAYFYFALFFSVIGIVFGYGKMDIWSLASWFEIGTSLLGLLGLYSFVYKKNYFTKSFWLGFFWVIVFDSIFNLIYFYTPLHDYLEIPSWFTSEAINSGSELLLSMILTLPMAYAIYILGKGKVGK